MNLFGVRVKMSSSSSSPVTASPAASAISSTNMYANGKIYKIVCTKEGHEDELYVGSTTTYLAKRMWAHKAASKRPRACPTPIYRLMSELGYEHFKIVLVEDFPCERREQLLMREEFWRKELAAKLNVIRAYRSAEVKAEHGKAYYASHKEERAEYNKAYKAARKEEIAKYNQAYKEAHREEIARYNQSYNAAHRDVLRESSKAYNAAHRDEKARYNQAYNAAHKAKGFFCTACNHTFTSAGNLKRHTQSKKHLANAAQREEEDAQKAKQG